VTYVWFDALLNYATAVGFGKPRHGGGVCASLAGASYHVVGKDITAFIA